MGAHYGYAAIDKDGKRKYRLYPIWSSMRSRCNCKTSQFYKNYGGRGIKVCARWESFVNFANDLGTPKKGMTLDRIDVNGNYCPENCRWATRKEQAYNRRNTRKLTYKGKTQNIEQWCKELPLQLKPYNLISRIFESKWSVERAFTTPLGRYNHKI